MSIGPIPNKPTPGQLYKAIAMAEDPPNFKHQPATQLLLRDWVYAGPVSRAWYDKAIHKVRNS